MRIVLALVVLLAIAACVTAPDRSARCIYPGDTLGVIVRYDSTHRISECAWLLSDKQTCYDERVTRTRIRCVVGDTSWSWR
jgi:hypothetical protein